MREIHRASVLRPHRGATSRRGPRRRRFAYDPDAANAPTVAATLARSVG